MPSYRSPTVNLSLVALVLVCGFSVTLGAVNNPSCWAEFEMVATGGVHTLGLLANGSLMSWGGNVYGQLGLGWSSKKEIFPHLVESTKKWTSIAAGESFSVGVKEDGTLWAFGYNRMGQLGDDTTRNHFAPVQIGTDNDWMNVTAGDYHTLGLKKNGSLYAWGLNEKGQLGTDRVSYSYKPLRLEPNKKWVFIAAGSQSSFGIQEDGSLFAWGNNRLSQLGDDSNRNVFVPVQIGRGIIWTTVRVTTYYTLALDNNGNLYAWGDNSLGGFGTGHNYEEYKTPKMINTGDIRWKSISVGSQHSMGIAVDGALYGWGVNTYAQLGVNFKSSADAPTRIGDLSTKWKSVAAGAFHTAGITENGTLYLWGENNDGQIGVGSVKSSILPEICDRAMTCSPCISQQANMDEISFQRRDSGDLEVSKLNKLVSKEKECHGILCPTPILAGAGAVLGGSLAFLAAMKLIKAKSEPAKDQNLLSVESSHVLNPSAKKINV